MRYIIFLAYNGVVLREDIEDRGDAVAAMYEYGVKYLDTQIVMAIQEDDDAVGQRIAVLINRRDGVDFQYIGDEAED